MADSPYISRELKEYIVKTQVEEKLNQAVNSLCRLRPDDPYSYLVDFLEQSCSQNIALEEITAEPYWGSDNLPTIRVDPVLVYKMKKYDNSRYNYCLGNLDDERVLYDGDDAVDSGKGMTKACQIINDKIASALQGIDCNDQKAIDHSLMEVYNNQEDNKGLNITLPVSIAIFKAVQTLRQAPLYKGIYSITDILSSLQVQGPQIFMTILQGSKAVNSKCRASRFYYLIPGEQSAQQKLQMAHTLVMAVRKIITAGKQGENALKQLQDCSYVCPSDTINDNMKLLDEAINQSGLKDQVKVGIDFAAENLYHDDVEKYELETAQPKGWLDINQLCDYYFKLCSDRPSIKYLEDPVIQKDPEQWRRVKDKLSEKSVQIGSRVLYKSIENCREHVELKKEEKNEEEDEKQDNVPGLTAEELEKNSQVLDTKPDERQSTSRTSDRDGKKTPDKGTSRTNLSKDTKKSKDKDVKLSATSRKTKDTTITKGGKSVKEEKKEEELPPSPEDALIHLDYAVLKYGDHPTLSSFLELVQFLKRNIPSITIVVSDNYVEHDDTLQSDIIGGIPGAAAMLGTPIKYERLVKYNRLIELEREIKN